MRAATRDHAPTYGRADRLRTGSLRRRVVVCVVVLLLAVIVTMCCLVNLVLGRRLHADARSQIVERARYAASLSGHGLTAQELADDLTGQGITASVISAGQVVVGRNHPPEPGLGGGRPGPGAPGAFGAGNAGPGSRGPVTSAVSVSVRQSHDALFVTLALPNGGRLQLVSSLAEIDRTLGLLHRVELAVAAGTLLLASGVLVIVVGAALTPLRRMRVLADRIRGGARGVRLRPTRPATDLGRTALALDEMLEALEAAEQQARSAQLRMRQLLADVSHDLRTPIAGVLTSAEQLLRDDPGRSAREQGLVELIREGRRAARLVEDLLLMTRLDAGEALPADGPPRSDALACAAAAVDALRRRLPDRQVLLTGERAWVGLEADKLIRLLTNLLDNAADATGPAGAITVTVRSCRDSTGSPSVWVDVGDDGPGVPAADQDRVFDRLVRLDPARRAGGSGLGLPIARALARTAGGDVRYAGSARHDGRGALFRVELPAIPAADEVDAATDTAQSGENHDALQRVATPAGVRP